MHQAGGETPLRGFGSSVEQTRVTTWCPRPPGQSCMRYDEAFYQGVTSHLDANLGTGKARDWGRPPMHQITNTYLAGAID